MEIFSEIYSCYYQVLRHLLCSQNALTIQDIRSQIHAEGFEETLLSIIPKLENGDWSLFKRGNDVFLSKLSPSFITPLSSLEKSYLKALLADARIGLFLTREQLEDLNAMLDSVSPLWTPEQFFCYDQFADGDPFQNETYRKNFRTLLQAQKKQEYVDIEYNPPGGGRLHHHYIPARIEYSLKNDKFRLLALKHSKNQQLKPEVLNIGRIKSVLPLDRTFSYPIDLNRIIQDSYYKEPLTLRIHNRRNALERAMLHFANYEKNTTKIDEDTYECLIYYNQAMETELLIEVLSFGPMLKVTGSERFLNSLKARLRKQMRIENT